MHAPLMQPETRPSLSGLFGRMSPPQPIPTSLPEVMTLPDEAMTGVRARSCNHMHDPLMQPVSVPARSDLSGMISPP